MIPGGLTPDGSVMLGMGAPGGPVPPPLYGADPKSQYLAEALQAMRSSPPSQGNAMGLDSNLLAQALMQYGMRRKPALSAPTATPNPALGQAWPGLQPTPYTGGVVPMTPYGC